MALDVRPQVEVMSSGGYDISRFVGLDQQLAKHLTCSICLDIMKSPVETKCRHTFCDNCIKRWLQTHNECPVCKTFVPNRQLDGCVMARNIINDLKYRCFTDTNGCQKDIEIQFLATHLEECERYLCEKCGLRMGRADDHNCLEAVKREVTKRETQNQTLRNHVKDLKRKLDESQHKYNQLEDEVKRNRMSSGPYAQRDVNLETSECYEVLDESPYQSVPQNDHKFIELYVRDGSDGQILNPMADIKVRIRLDSQFYNLLPILRQRDGYRHGRITLLDPKGHIIPMFRTPRNTCHRLKDPIISVVISCHNN